MTTAPMAPRFGFTASTNARRWEVAHIVSELREILGARLVAYLGGVKETRAVAGWIDESRKPGSAAVEQRLRDAYHVAALLSEMEAKGVVQAWFLGMNPQLGDRSPARVLRDGSTEAAADVLRAARAFVATAG